MIQKHVELIGFKARDAVTGFTGVIASVCFDLYGCIQVCLSPPVDKEGKIPDSGWFDVTRIEVISEERVMKLPEFNRGYVAEGRKGAADKPAFNK